MLWTIKVNCSTSNSGFCWTVWVWSGIAILWTRWEETHQDCIDIRQYFESQRKRNWPDRHTQNLRKKENNQQDCQNGNHKAPSLIVKVCGQFRSDLRPPTLFFIDFLSVIPSTNVEQALLSVQPYRRRYQHIIIRIHASLLQSHVARA